MQWIRRLDPIEAVVAEVYWDINVGRFMPRFKKCLGHMLAFFHCHDDLAADQLKEILWYEDHHFGQVILNVVAGEGDQRVIHGESWPVTRDRFMQAGLKPIALSTEVLENIQQLADSCQRSCGVTVEDGACLVFSWKKHPFMFAGSFGTHSLHR